MWTIPSNNSGHTDRHHLLALFPGLQRRHALLAMLAVAWQGATVSVNAYVPVRACVTIASDTACPQKDNFYTLKMVVAGAAVSLGWGLFVQSESAGAARIAFRAVT